MLNRTGIKMFGHDSFGVFVFLNAVTIILFVWSQYDGGNIKQKTIGYGCRQNQ